MRNLFAMALVIALLGSIPAVAQKVDGHPDMQGIWTYSTLTPLERPREFAGKEVLSEQEAAAYVKRLLQSRNVDNDRETAPTARGIVNGSVETADLANAYNEFWWDRGTGLVKTRRTSIVTDPPDGKIPALTPAAKKKLAALEEASERPAQGPEDRPVSERCIVRPNSGPPMTPTGYNNNFRLIQAPGYVVILNEQIHDARIIPTDGRPHLPQNVRLWMGDSRGHWDGNTLVVETTNFTDKANFHGSGAKMNLVERFTLSDPGTLLYEFTVNDPESFTKSWTGQIPMTRGPDHIYEYACHEGNYSLTTTLSSARALEKESR
jgi:hypothetical protein